MDVILLQDVEGLGLAGDVVNVKPGFLRNYLVPRKLALRASKRNLALADEKKRVTQARLARQDKINQELAATLEKIEITIEMQVGEEERLFGSVTTQNIQKSLADQNIQIERHDILLEEPIKALGVYTVPIKLASEIKPEIKVYVIKG
jgi:large subunit ribosomal protein L9